MLDDITFIFTSPIFTASLMAPSIRWIFPSLTGYNRRLQILQRFRTFVDQEIDAHEQALDEDDPRDFIDQYLLEVKKNPEEFSKSQLQMICFDLFGAGSDTSSSTLCWCLMFLTLHPHLQETCHQEVERAAGDEQLTADLVSSLQYCQAFIAECQRLGQVAPTSVMHRVTSQVSSTPLQLLHNIKFLIIFQISFKPNQLIFSVHLALWSCSA